MKKAGLGALLLFSAVHLVIAQLLPSTYLAYELAEWMNRIEMLMRTGYSVPEERASDTGECFLSKNRNDYLYIQIRKYLQDIGTKFERMKATYTRRMESVKAKMSVDKYIIHDRILDINHAFDNLIKRLAPDHNDLDPADICGYAVTQLRENNLKDQIDLLRNEVFNPYGSGSNSLPALITEFKNISSTLCDNGYSLNGYIHSIYSEIISSEVKGYITMLFSYWYPFKYNGIYPGCIYEYPESPDEIIAKLHNEFSEIIIDYMEKFLSLMQDLPRDFRACNAVRLERDSTFVELQGAIQTVGMPGPYTGHCGYINSTGVDPNAYCYDGSDFLCIELPRPCLGHIYNCKASYHPAGVCMADFPEARRYEWIYSTELGPEGSCLPKNSYSIYYETWWSCFCKCIDNQPDSWSTHIVNLQPVEADIEENKIVTGVRILINHNVLHLQIQQGKLLQNWEVENATWKDIIDSSEEIYAHRINRKIRGQKPNVTENIDYRVIAENEAFNLDDIKVPHNHILTGVKFHYGADEHLSIAIITRKFDPSTGKLVVSEGPNIESVEGTSRRESKNDPKSPLLAAPNIRETSTPNLTYVLFRESDWTFDSGQTTVPIFDAIPVSSNPPSPLGGVGIFHKTASKAAGILSLKLFSLDYAAYMKESVESSLKLQGGAFRHNAM